MLRHAETRANRPGFDGHSVTDEASPDRYRDQQEEQTMTECWDSNWTGTDADPCVSISLNGQEIAVIDRGSTTSRIRGAIVLRFRGEVKVFAKTRVLKANIQAAIDHVVSVVSN